MCVMKLGQNFVATWFCWLAEGSSKLPLVSSFFAFLFMFDVHRKA
jgi:hypothetical protein